MILISYDFHNTKTRSKFSRFIKKYGRRLQYSVYEIKNSKRILNIIIREIDLEYAKQFDDCDSILIMYLCEACQKKIIRYGYAAAEEEELVIFS